MSYVTGFLTPVKAENKERYIESARVAWPLFKGYGALAHVENWGVDVPHGKVTDFYMATQAKEDETTVFSWIEWPDKATRDAGMKKVMEDPRMQPGDPMPFDGKRLVFGGFQGVVDA